MDPQSKILAHSAVDAWMVEQRACGRRVGFTCGSFDLLHPGHVQYLGQARELCDALLVAVNTDASVRRYKNPLRPINPEQDRMYLIAGLASVDGVTHLDDDRPLGLLMRWKPDLYIKGGDYKAESLKSGDAVRAYGGRVEVIRPQFATSTTGTLERIAALALHATPERVAPGAAAGLALLDRDGTLIRNVPFLHEPDKVELLPGVMEGLQRLQAAGLRLAIVSNQQGIGLGYYTAQDFVAVNQRLLGLLAPHGIRIAKIYFCPHSMADACECRKPAAGMLTRAMRDFAVEASYTVMLGDSAVDLEAAAAAGVVGFRAGEGEFTSAVDAALARMEVRA